MDEYERFRQVCADTVSKKVSDGAATQTWTADNGAKAEGWLIEQYERYRNEYHKAKYDWADEKRDGYYILGTDGEVYQFVQWSSADQSTPQGESGRDLWRLSATQLAGNVGQPFAKFSQKIKRMKW